MKRSVDEIRQDLRAHLPELRERYGVTYLGIFGSCVRGEQKKTSDVDILVEFDRPGTLPGFIHLQNDLVDLLRVRVDLVEKNGSNPRSGPMCPEKLYRSDQPEREAECRGVPFRYAGCDSYSP